MSDVSISILHDHDNGRALVIRLTGVALLPPGTIYRISPSQRDHNASLPVGWPSGDLKPAKQFITRDGVDLLLGPDVAASPALRPGTPVTVSVPAIDAFAELTWPGDAAQRPELVVASNAQPRLSNIDDNSSPDRGALVDPHAGLTPLVAPPVPAQPVPRSPFGDVSDYAAALAAA
ncbi:MAG: hypothetical protein ACK5JT_14945, partial [Hyphomicrobiaceae bacterium]